MWQCACPNAMLLSSFGGVFKTLPFDGTRFAEGFGGFYRRLADLFVWDVFGEEQVGHFTAGCSSGFVYG